MGDFRSIVYTVRYSADLRIGYANLHVGLLLVQRDNANLPAMLPACTVRLGGPSCTVRRVP